MRLLWALIVAASLTPAGIAAESFSGKVVAISDGDTIRVMHNGRAERIRLWGIDCPEKRQPFGTRATQFTGDLASVLVSWPEPRDASRALPYSPAGPPVPPHCDV